MKKIKLLTPILGLTALAGVMAPLTSCACNTQEKVREASIAPTYTGIADVEAKLDNGNEIITIKTRDTKKRIKDIHFVKIGDRVLTKDEYTFDVDAQTITIKKEVLDKYQGSISVWPGDLEDKPILQSIKVTPNKTSYNINDKFTKKNDVKVEAIYKKGEVEQPAIDVTDKATCTCDTWDLSKEFSQAGKHTIKVSFEDKSDTYEISVKAAVVTHEMDYDATDKKYKSAESFDVEPNSSVVCQINVAEEDGKAIVPETFSLEVQSGNELVPIKEITSVMLDDVDITDLCDLVDNQIEFDLSSKTLTSSSKIKITIVSDNTELKKVKAMCEPIVVLPYIEIVGNNSFSLGINDDVGGEKCWNGTLEYSTDKTNWNEWYGDFEIPAVQTEGQYCLYLRGKDNTTFVQLDQWGPERYTIFKFSGDATEINLNGSIMSLLDYKNQNSAKMDPYCFYYLFYECTNLITAPKLPSKNLSEGCYSNMFYRCSSLTKTPILPATELKARCYEQMFINCVGIKNIGKISKGKKIDISSDYALNGMFKNCNPLKIVEGSEDDCFINIGDVTGTDAITDMFAGCATGSATAEANNLYKIGA